MAKYEYSYYPGCSSQNGASSSNLGRSIDTMCEELDVKLNEIPDWNCCSASIGYGGGSVLPRRQRSASRKTKTSSRRPIRCWPRPT